jgi:hypothetical protein
LEQLTKRHFFVNYPKQGLAGKLSFIAFMTCRQRNQAIAYSALEMSHQIGLILEPTKQNSF